MKWVRITSIALDDEFLITQITSQPQWSTDTVALQLIDKISRWLTLSKAFSWSKCIHIVYPWRLFEFWHKICSFEKLEDLKRCCKVVLFIISFLLWKWQVKSNWGTEGSNGNGNVGGTLLLPLPCQILRRESVVAVFVPFVKIRPFQI